MLLPISITSGIPQEQFAQALKPLELAVK